MISTLWTFYTFLKMSLQKVTSKVLKSKDPIIEGKNAAVFGL